MEVNILFVWFDIFTNGNIFRIQHSVLVNFSLQSQKIQNDIKLRLSNKKKCNDEFSASCKSITHTVALQEYVLSDCKIENLIYREILFTDEDF